jgi:HB1, ASXL, restriction endonuclease HTH domain
MAKKTKAAGNTANDTTASTTPALKIGSRVRCTDDGVEGRITWANAVSVKIEWADGEKVTWRRDSLAKRPIMILDAQSEDQTPAPTDSTAAEPTTATEQPQAERETMPATSEPTETEPAATPAEPIASEPTAVPEATTEPTTPGADTEAAPTQPKPKRQRKTPALPKEKKVSALDAAAKVLAEAGQAMTCKEMIGVMAFKGYWSSPGGKTPDATLCSAILREISVKGDQSRFIKTAPGRFAFQATP